MSAPSRFPNGISTGISTGDVGGLCIPDPTAYHLWMDDFDNYTAGDWIVTTTEAGSGSATEATSNEDGGVLVLTNAAGDNDNDYLQYSGTTSSAAIETFLFETGKKLHFKTRFKVSDIDQVDMIMGLQITSTTPLGATDGVWFSMAAAAGTVKLSTVKNSTATSGTVTTAVDDTYMVLAFEYDGVSSIKGFVNNAHVVTLATTNLPDDEELTISFGHQNGEAVAKVMSIDYIMVAKER